MNEHEAKPVKSIEKNSYHMGRGKGAPKIIPSAIGSSAKRTNGKMPKK